jgi:hypothetical protein
MELDQMMMPADLPHAAQGIMNDDFDLDDDLLIIPRAVNDEADASDSGSDIDDPMIDRVACLVPALQLG